MCRIRIPTAIKRDVIKLGKWLKFSNILFQKLKTRMIILLASPNLLDFFGNRKRERKKFFLKYKQIVVCLMQTPDSVCPLCALYPSPSALFALIWLFGYPHGVPSLNARKYSP